MEILKERYTITELSNKLNVTDHTLRYYEKEFNLNIPKDSRGRRFYTTELANLLYQIKNMRDEGLEIKAIKKIMLTENLIEDTPEIILDDSSMPLVPLEINNTPKDIIHFFKDFKEELSTGLTNEITSAKEHFTKEITRSKLELGACMENGLRKLESKMERHFQEVDRSLGVWREKNKKGFFKKLLRKIAD